VVLSASLLLATSALAPRASADDSIGLSVDVLSTSPSPSPTRSSTTSSTSTSVATSGSLEPTVAGTEGSGTAEPGTGEDELGGLLYVSGLNWRYTPSLNPAAGSLEVWFSVRNAFDEPVDSSAQFWLTGMFGQTVGTSATVGVLHLQPGETRTVSATIDGLAQWTVVTARMMFTPPPRLGSQTLSPVHRDEVVWFLPWFVILLVALGGAGYVGWRWWRGRATALTEVAGAERAAAEAGVG
jgi:hypothetical protein